MKRLLGLLLALWLLLLVGVAWGDDCGCAKLRENCYREQPNPEVCESWYRACLEKCSGAVAMGTSGPHCGRPGQPPCLDKKGTK